MIRQAGRRRLLAGTAAAGTALGRPPPHGARMRLGHVGPRSGPLVAHGFAPGRAAEAMGRVRDAPDPDAVAEARAAVGLGSGT